MTRDDLLSLRKVETVTAGDVTVHVRRWSGRSRLVFDNEAGKQRDKQQLDIHPLLSLVFALSVTDGHGQPLFTPDDVKQIDESIPGDLLLAVWDWACSANGLLRSGQEQSQKN